MCRARRPHRPRRSENPDAVARHPGTNLPPRRAGGNDRPGAAHRAGALRRGRRAPRQTAGSPGAGGTARLAGERADFPLRSGQGSEAIVLALGRDSGPGDLPTAKGSSGSLAALPPSRERYLLHNGCGPCVACPVGRSERTDREEESIGAHVAETLIRIHTHYSGTMTSPELRGPHVCLERRCGHPEEDHLVTPELAGPCEEVVWCVRCQRHEVHRNRSWWPWHRSEPVPPHLRISRPN